MSEPTSLIERSPAERHRIVSATFGSLTEAASDWDVPTPVADWLARDVVRHLVEWFPGFLAAGGIELAQGPSVDADPVGAWRAQSRAVQALLDDPAAAAAEFTHPQTGDHRLENAIDLFYTADVFMHTWDLARAIGDDGLLDPEYSAHLLSGMEPIEEALRRSGHYGPPVAVPQDADATSRLMGFIGRDPSWQPPAA